MSRIFIFGNSHLASFRNRFNKKLREDKNGYEIFFIPTLWTKDQDWLKGLLEGRIIFSEEYSLPNIEIDQIKDDDVVVFIGLNLLGDGMIRAHGRLTTVEQGAPDGKSVTPRLPMIYGTNGNIVPEHSSGFISEDCSAEIYKNFFNKIFFSQVDKLLSKFPYISFYCIAAPDMTEECAKYRFGPDILESGLYAMHRRIARKVVDNCALEEQWSGKIIFHSEDLSMESGFTDDTYSRNESLGDIHVSPSYYDGSISELMEKLMP